MDVTLLGSGEVTGVPPLFGDLDAAGAKRRRRRPSLLVESSETTVMLTSVRTCASRSGRWGSGRWTPRF